MRKSTVQTIRDVSRSVVAATLATEDLMVEAADPSLLTVGAKCIRGTAKGLRAFLQEGGSPAELLRNTFDPRIIGGTRRRYSATPPWVQPSPHRPDRVPPAVMHVPAEEVTEFMELVVSRYLRTLHRQWPVAVGFAFRNRTVELVDDAELGRLVAGSVFSRRLNPRLDPDVEETFREVLNPAKKEAGRYLVLDLRALDRLDPLPGLHIAPTVTLFERDDARGILPVAISIAGLVARPCHEHAFALAKVYVLQGAANHAIVGDHPLVHFPMDSVNAVTKGILPSDHIVYRLLEPHMQIQLPIDFAVLNLSKSVLWNDQNELYTPFPSSKEGQFGLLEANYLGIPGNSSYPAYRYPLAPPEIHSDYGRYFSAYWEIMYRFVDRVIGPHGVDEHVVRWASHLSEFVPGFPDGQSIRQGDTLVRVLTAYIHDVSVMHSADHHTYWRMPITKVPLRLRCPPPDRLDMPPLNPHRLVRKEDVFRHFLAHEMYFKNNVMFPLGEVEYDFVQSGQRDAAASFREDLRRVDEEVAPLGYSRLSDLATSIQF